MFGLRNQRGSCWINAALQGVFRIPDLQERFKNDEIDSKNEVESCLSEIWGSKGDEGLKQFYECVKKKVEMPAGEGIGDSHELIDFLCDKVPFLDKLLRFKIANHIRCNSCSYSDVKYDSLLEFSIAPSKPHQSISDVIVETVKPYVIDDWKCETCSKKGCTKQFLVGSFPQVLMFHQTSVDTSVSYPPILSVNKIQYALISVVCFSSGHWYTFGRDLPPGGPWYELNDMHVRSYDPKHFPLADSMRLLMYYRLKE